MVRYGTWVALALTLSVGACGKSRRHPGESTAAPAPVDLGGAPVKSGERLRAIEWVAEDGMHVATSRFFDTVRGEECSFWPSGGSETYCYPDGLFTSELFSFDAACETPAFPSCYRYVLLDEESGCNTIPTVYELGATIDEKALAGPDCTNTETWPGDNYRPLGTRLAKDEFARASRRTTPPNGQRLGTEQLDTADGAAIVYGFYDHAERSECGSWDGPNDTVYCIPAPRGFVDTYFEDAECTGTGRRLIGSTCATDRLGFDAEEQQLYRVGRPLARMPPFIALASSGCFESNFDVGYELGQGVSITAFEPLASVRVGEGRLRVTLQRAAHGGTSIPSTVFGDTTSLWDDELGLSCSIVLATDGEYRCVPSTHGTFETPAFADERCELPLVGRRADERAGSEPDWLVTIPAQNREGCGLEPARVVYELDDAPFDGIAYRWTLDADGKRACGPSTGTGQFDVFAPLEEVPPSRFVRFEKQIE